MLNRNAKKMTVAEKSMAMSYVLSQLLIENLEIVILEVKGKPEYGRFNDKLMKLRGASRNTFRVLEKNTGELDSLKLAIEETLYKLWD